MSVPEHKRRRVECSDTLLGQVDESAMELVQTPQATESESPPDPMENLLLTEAEPTSQELNKTLDDEQLPEEDGHSRDNSPTAEYPLHITSTLFEKPVSVASGDSNSEMVPDGIDSPKSLMCSEVNDDVDWTKSWLKDDGRLDGLPPHDRPGLPKKDPYEHLRELCLNDTYKQLPRLKLAKGFFNSNKQDDEFEISGVCYADLENSLTGDQQDFVLKAIQFKSYKDSVINLSRGNPFCKSLHFDKLFNERSSTANRFLMFGKTPIMCLSFGILSSSDLKTVRTFISGSTEYGVKDAHVQLLRYELERLNAALAQVLQAPRLYYSGTAVGTPTISIGTRFVTLDALSKASKSSNRSTSRWLPLPNTPYGSSEAVSKRADTRVLKNRYILFPSDDVPIYDFSKLDFDFSTHFDRDKLDLHFERVQGEPIANVPAIFAYYPSVWTKDDKQIVSLNIAWVGVLEA